MKAVYGVRFMERKHIILKLRFLLVPFTEYRIPYTIYLSFIIWALTLL